MSLLVDRMIRAAKLDVHLYEEVKADKGALGQAISVVVLSYVVLELIASFNFWGLEGMLLIMSNIIGSLTGMFWYAIGLFGWYVWVLCTYLIGTKLLPEPQTHATHNELLRTVGFATSPGIIGVLGIIPGLRLVAGLAGTVWTGVATVVAVRQALGYHSTLRAIAVCVIGLVASSLIFAIVFWPFFIPP